MSAHRYFDASALTKLYLSEPASGEVRAQIAPGRVVTSRWSVVELTSALARRMHDGQLAPPAFEEALARMKTDLDVFHLIDMGSDVLDRAAELLKRRRLRAGDALHLASCLLYSERIGKPVELMGFDQRLNEAAKAEGCPLTATGV